MSEQARRLFVAQSDYHGLLITVFFVAAVIVASCFLIVCIKNGKEVEKYKLKFNMLTSIVILFLLGDGRVFSTQPKVHKTLL